MGSRAGLSGAPVLLPAAPFQLSSLTAPVSSFSVEMRPLRRLQGGDAEVSQAGVCVTGDEVSPYPTLPSPTLNSLPQSPGEEGVWDPGESLAEVLNLCGDGERTRDDEKECGPRSQYRISFLPPPASIQVPAPPAGGGAILDGQNSPRERRVFQPGPRPRK